MRVLVAGPRDYDDVEEMSDVFIEHMWEASVVMTDGRPGVPQVAEEVAGLFNAEVKTIRARGFDLLDRADPDLLVAWPGDRETNQLIRMAKENHVEVVLVRGDG